MLKTKYTVTGFLIKYLKIGSESEYVLISIGVHLSHEFFLSFFSTKFFFSVCYILTHLICIQFL